MIVGQNECSGHTCMPIAELHQQVRKHKVAKTMQGERRTTELARVLYDRTAMVTQSVHIDDIDAFGIRFCASIMIANDFAIRVLGLNALCHFEQRTIVKYQGNFGRE